MLERRCHKHVRLVIHFFTSATIQTGANQRLISILSSVINALSGIEPESVCLSIRRQRHIKVGLRILNSPTRQENSYWSWLLTRRMFASLHIRESCRCISWDVLLPHNIVNFRHALFIKLAATRDELVIKTYVSLHKAALDIPYPFNATIQPVHDSGKIQGEKQGAFRLSFSLLYSNFRMTSNLGT